VLLFFVVVDVTEVFLLYGDHSTEYCSQAWIGEQFVTLKQAKNNVSSNISQITEAHLSLRTTYKWYIQLHKPLTRIDVVIVHCASLAKDVQGCLHIVPLLQKVIVI